MRLCLRAFAVTAMFALAVVFAPAALAQSRQGGGSNDRQGYQGQSSQSSQNQFGQGQNFSGQQGETRQLTGKVVRTKHVEVSNSQTDVLVAQLETNNGQRIVVDLGPVDDLRDHNVHIKKGEQITVSGRTVPLGNYQVLMANEITAGKTNMNVDRSWMNTLGMMRGGAGWQNQTAQGQGWQGQNWQSQGWQGQGWQAQQSQGQGQGAHSGHTLRHQQAQGRIQSTHEVQLMGLGTNIEIALLQSPQEQQPIVVVFGPESDLNGLQLQNGSNITVRGQECNAHNTPVLLAREVTVNGHTIQTSLARARMQRIQGEVTQTGQVTIPGLNETLEVAHLETNSGEPAIVVLGPHQRIQGHQPRRGDQISVRGEAVQINGQTVLLARTLAAGGKTAGLHGSQTQGQYR